MGITDDIADELALETLRIEKETGDEDVAKKVAEILGASSQTTQEAYLTSMRVRRAEIRARVYLEDMAKDLPDSKV